MMSVDTSELRDAGKYIIEVDMVQEGMTWISEQGGKTFRGMIILTE